MIKNNEPLIKYAGKIGFLIKSDIFFISFSLKEPIVLFLSIFKTLQIALEKLHEIPFIFVNP